ncbi:DUF4232 domain-containing protein [Corynebacterium halotolerans]|uniref:DUF4232 domain-containing protein n=1 Tax=Corynebacterium halotolerans YIM 70093 = DSM 44683 TaxID=1121362 RepID=M1NN53_9CORY|nr:DUF4232 domain-containing protein [Corynebacterium halotolerans]AGF72798.1 hypothetical protein A605_08980 [Corynebacterium halotolerans YIM 70093 = DSM 44683]
MSPIALIPRRIPLLLGAGGALAVLTACGQADPAPPPPETVTETATTTAAPVQEAGATDTSDTTDTRADGAESPPPPGACHTDGLDISLVAQQGAAGSVIHTLGFTNTTDAPCELTGFPGVSLVGYGDGTQIGAAAVREARREPQPVSLAPGGTAHADVRTSRAEIHDPAACGGVVPADGLRIYPPGNTAAAFLPVEGMTGCSSGEVELLTVRPVTPAA